MRSKRHKAKKTATPLSYIAPAKVPFKEHVAELRRRLFFIVASVAVWSVVGYFIHHQVVDILLVPIEGQKLIYTSPISGMNFLLKIAFYVGIACSIPVIVYQFLRYLEPLMKRGSSRFILWGSLASGLLAVGGILFGYFLGLPAAMHFLLNQFITDQVSALLTVDAYLQFVLVYMFGAAIMFQIPLIVLFINRIKPLKPSQLMRAQRWVIVGTVTLAFIMNPTPSLVDQLFLAVPMVLSYQFAILMVWWLDRRQKAHRAMQVADKHAQAVRQEKAREFQTSWQIADELAEAPAGAGLLQSKNSLTDIRPLKPGDPAPEVVLSSPQFVPPNLVNRGPQPLRGKFIQ